MLAYGSFPRWVSFSVALVAATTGLADAARACTPGRDPDGVVFPISATTDGRRFTDAAGRPFLLHGDTAWSLIGDLTREDADLYLRDRRARGFNTLLVNLIEHRFSRNAPANAYGDPPFPDAPFGALGDAYFDHARWILDRACDLGFLVLLTPAYAGAGGGPEGWYAEMAASRPLQLVEYGRRLGERFGDLRNIVWVHGGDYDAPDKSLSRSVVQGLTAAGDTNAHAYHGAPESRPAELLAGEAWISLDTVYTYGDVASAALTEWRANRGTPFILFESAYENEHGADGRRVRMQAWQAMLSGAAGHVYGNNPIWHFDGPTLHPAPSGWKDQLGSRGARSMTALRSILEDHEWWRLEPWPGFLAAPETGQWWPLETWIGLLDWERDPDPSRPIAAIADDGSFALVYVPRARSVLLNLAAFSAEGAIAQWRDPTTGAMIDARRSLLTAAPVEVSPPSRNGGGDEDWILVLRALGSPQDSSP
jgi:hypothetical protein